MIKQKTLLLQKIKAIIYELKVTACFVFEVPDNKTRLMFKVPDNETHVSCLNQSHYEGRHCVARGGFFFFFDNGGGRAREGGARGSFPIAR